ncbi:Ribosomal protein L11 methylase PrmA [Desulfacinum hydrothermale DSM 13146]|uniref:Ribosomal protein L11 methylase PrmA n=1 Tax=Desulfacinum hydrothermale DSM 13146 TaxID=1121390 RepID=A0A1W1XN67_9BACT|nr:50S ribosomal protein L11 methyltransferase [Desulfacinum hydrothermale]SMC25403.1 Ribosomal protein L11 methylase PrmA [Desulfacinum hydrothermale DSM 13146]
MAQEKHNVKRSKPVSTALSGRRPRRLYVLEWRGKGSAKNLRRLPGYLGAWPEPPYTYLFFEESPTDETRRAVEDAFCGKMTGEYDLDFHQWQQVRPASLRVGSFLITAEPPGTPWDEDHHPIVLTPGLVFGTGVHPTTRACLLLLERIYGERVFEDVVDLGTGTGVLAVAAARLGARRIVALDANPMAVREAAVNAARNDLQGTVFPVAGRDLEAVGAFGDLLLMNLEWPSLKGVLAQGAWRRFSLVLAAGFLSSQYREFLERLPAGFRVRDRLAVDGWEAVAACRTGP